MTITVQPTNKNTHQPTASKAKGTTEPTTGKTSAATAEPAQAPAAGTIDAPKNGGAFRADGALAPTDPKPASEPRRGKAIPNQTIVIYESTASKLDGASLKGLKNLGQVAGESGSSYSMALVDTRFDSLDVIKESGAKILFEGPNYEYLGLQTLGGTGKGKGKGKKRKPGGINEVKVTPNDPDVMKQYQHYAMRNDVAWAQARGKGAVVAVFDDGHDLDHEDLMGQMWINTKEVPGDGIDNDSNGYIDDVEGLDVVDHDVDPRNGTPAPNSWGVNSADHGTHVDGIVNARDNNGRGIAGVAPDAKVMPIRWYNYGQWTSAMIAESLLYAANNGAHVANISYATNHWIGDTVIEEALGYMYDKGVAIVTAAGNSRRVDDRNEAITEMLLIASTEEGDKASSFTNYGIGIDISSPGGKILSTVTGPQKYEKFSGTSMAAPDFAGALAAVMSNHPEWSRAQVVDHVLGNADPIDDINAVRYKGRLGAGRVNVGEAIRSQSNPAPQFEFIVGNRFGKKTVTVDIVNNGVFEDEVINNMEAFTLVQKRNAKGKRVNDKMFARPQDDYKIGTNQLEFDFSHLKPGTYELRANRKTIKDPFGQKLEGATKVEFVVE